MAGWTTKSRVKETAETGHMGLQEQIWLLFVPPPRRVTARCPEHFHDTFTYSPEVYMQCMAVHGCLGPQSLIAACPATFRHYAVSPFSVEQIVLSKQMAFWRFL